MSLKSFAGGDTGVMVGLREVPPHTEDKRQDEANNKNYIVYLAVLSSGTEHATVYKLR